MGQLRVPCFSLSLDGFAAGPEQRLEKPNGIEGLDTHEWFFPTATFQQLLYGKETGTTGIDNDFAARGIQDIGAWILGRSMFGPVRSPWPDQHWKGWWGENPPFHTPVFVLTYHARAHRDDRRHNFSLRHGRHPCDLERARAAEGGMDVRLGGGVATIQQ